MEQPINSNVFLNMSICFALLVCFLAEIGFAQIDQQQQQHDLVDQPFSLVTILPPPQLRPNVNVNIRDWTRKLSEEIRAVSNKTNCLVNIERFYQKQAVFQGLDPVKMRDQILNKINTLLAQHRAAVSAIASEAEKLAVTHNFVKNLRFNYTDVHRLRNELDPNTTNQQDSSQLAQTAYDPSIGTVSGNVAGQVPQFTSINGGTPVPGPAEWQTPFKSIVMQVNKNFGDIPVNTSMSAIHLPLPIYPGLPEIMNGIAWTERLDYVFKRNLANYMHVHHQYYGDHLGFLRTFPAHKWRIPRTDPDLFDARMRPWYVEGASSAKDVVILVDTSGSMTGLRREIAKGVVFEILDTLTDNDHFSVMRFSETVTPIGIPKCSLKTPKLALAMEEQCHDLMVAHDQRNLIECERYRKQLENRGRYMRDHPNVLSDKNGSYLTDDVYKKSIFNVTQDINDAYLLPANSRNIRYLKSNFSMPTAGIANFTHALMAAFELLQAYNRSGEGSQCNQAIMLITDGATKSHDDVFNHYNYPNSPIRVFTYMIGREVGDITHIKAMACNNRGYYTHVINLSEVREQVQKYLPVMARPMVLAHQHPISWTYAYGDETHQVLTDWVLETKRRERARIMLNEERERLNEANSTDVINIELTNITEYDELPLVDEELKNRIICEDNNNDDQNAMDQSLEEELDPLGYNDLSCHWTLRRADLLTSVVKPVFDNRNTTLYFQRVLYKNIWTEQETHVRNAQLLGVVAVDIRIGDIVKTAPSHLLGPNGYAVLMGNNGFLMHHPELRALLEDPFDKQSKILKPYFNSVDLTHVEQVHHKNESDLIRKKNDDIKLFKLREAAVRRQTGYESIYVKRAVDCRKRLHIRQQVFYYGPIKDTPFSFIIALPQNYGLNRLVAKLDLSQHSPTYFNPSAFDLWTVHPDYKYCESANLSNNNSLLEVMEAVNAGSANRVLYDDLSAVDGSNAFTSKTGAAYNDRIVCDKELFPSLLFDAAATFEKPDSLCGTTTFDNDCDRPMSAFSSLYGSVRDESCARSAEEMRSKMANIYGLEMSFLATRSGLTRVKVFDLTPRIKKLADLFIKRHNRAVDEAWYSRAVDWNMRFHEDATIITVPYNAYIKLVAKLRQRITQRHPAVNDTRANCDPLLDNNYGEVNSVSMSNSGLLNEDELIPTTGSTQPASVQNDQGIMSSYSSQLTSGVADTNSSGAAETSDQLLQQVIGRSNYNDFTSYDFLDLLTNSSVHISATQSVIANKGSKQRSPVAVSGLLYDYATFARRFLNTTSLNIRVLPGSNEDSPKRAPNSGNNVKVDICPGGDCAIKCGYRNDTIDCLLVDNNAFIIVGEELPHIGRPLNDYDEKLMQSLVERRVFHQVIITDYQAICTRNDQQPVEQQQRGAILSSQISSSVSLQPLKLDLLRTLLSNFVSSSIWIWSTLVSLLAYQSADFSDLGNMFLGQYMQHQRSVLGASAQSAISNQSLLALLPNKTYLRPCEKTTTLYETRPIDPNKLGSDSPEFFVTKCGCSGWYVYDAVPKTNLIMLIVNTTSACRKCEPSPPAPSNFVPIQMTPQQLNPSGNNLMTAVSTSIGNKTTEDQVCIMLERESQLYVKRPSFETHCHAYQPEEVHIHICGAASKSASVSSLLIIVTMLLITSTMLKDQMMKIVA